MSSPYPGSPAPQPPQGGGQPPSSGQWGSPPPAPGGPAGYPGAAGGPAPAYGAGQPPEKKKPWALIVGICGCLTLIAALVLAGGGFLLFGGGGEEGPTDGPSTSEGPTSDEPTTDEPTTDEPTTDEPTTDEPTTDEPTDAAGLPGVSGYETAPVQDPTDADLEAAKEATVAFLKALGDNDPAKACSYELDPITGTGVDDSSVFKDDCVADAQAAIDEEGLEGQAGHLTTDLFEATLNAEGRVIEVRNIHAEGGDSIKVAKGSDGKLYVVLG